MNSEESRFWPAAVVAIGGGTTIHRSDLIFSIKRVIVRTVFGFVAGSIVVETVIRLFEYPSVWVPIFPVATPLDVWVSRFPDESNVHCSHNSPSFTRQ